jgi:non-ribosomal peptide synthetase-like protein
VAKWALVGRIRAEDHPLWSSFVWRNELADTFVEVVAAPCFARASEGTPVLNLWLRTMGVSVGRGVWCETYWLPEADLVELCRLIPVAFSAGLGLGVALALVTALQLWGGTAALLLSGPLLAVVGLVAALVATAAKWALVGRHRAVEHPLWSSFVWRNELADAFIEMVAVPWFVRGTLTTPVFTLWLRSLGAHIGRGVWCESYWLPEPDLVRIGDGATVNRGCVLQTHLFHDRIMSMDTVTLQAGATLGPQSVILPAARLGESATVGPSSLVLRGDEVPAGSRWIGNPIAPW